MEEETQYKERLGAIANTLFGELSDEEVLHLLALRKQLQIQISKQEQVQKEEKKLVAGEAEKKSIEKELASLNALISPDKPDDELIHLVEERKTLEARLEAAVAELALLRKKKDIPKETQILVEKETANKVVDQVSVAQDKLPPRPKTVLQVEPEKSEQPETLPTPSVDEEFGGEKIIESSLAQNDGLIQYLEQIKKDPSSMGKVLERLPESVKKDKLFMLEVASIDPAYAMHYAADVLKKNEDFNLKVVAIKNEHHSGSVLAEMVPLARTGKVVLAAVKQDYRNVRFVLPQMEEYDEIMEKAKKGALDKVKEMKDSVDAALLIPTVLKKDAAFMKKVVEVTSQV